MSALGPQHGSQSQGPILPSSVSLPSKSSMFQTTGKSQLRHPSWRENTFPHVSILPKASQLDSGCKPRVGNNREGKASVPAVGLAPVNYLCYHPGMYGQKVPHSISLHTLAPCPLRPNLLSLEWSMRPIFLPATILRVLPLPKAPFYSPQHRIHTTSTGHSPFSVSEPPHLPWKVPSFHNLVPGISSQGAGLLSNLSGPTHSPHTRSMIGGGRHPHALLRRGGGGAVCRKSAGGAEWKAVL